MAKRVVGMEAEKEQKVQPVSQADLAEVVKAPFNLGKLEHDGKWKIKVGKASEAEKAKAIADNKMGKSVESLARALGRSIKTVEGWINPSSVVKKSRTARTYEDLTGEEPKPVDKAYALFKARESYFKNQMLEDLEKEIGKIKNKKDNGDTILDLYYDLQEAKKSVKELTEQLKELASKA